VTQSLGKQKKGRHQQKKKKRKKKKENVTKKTREPKPDMNRVFHGKGQPMEVGTRHKDGNEPG